MSNGPRRNAPSVNELLDSPQLKGLVNRISRWKLVSTVRSVLDEVSAEFHSAAAEKSLPNVGDLAERIARRVVEDVATPLRPVVNATGVLLDPALGGPPLAETATRASADIAQEYVNLEINLEAGRCERRSSVVEGLLCELSGAEAALVVNNNAAAVLATLGALAHGREVLVSRGQLVEIGHHFRLPEAIAAAGAELREVGTTNKTRAADYEAALSDRCGVLMMMVPWHYAVRGQTVSTDLGELASLGRRWRVPTIGNLGPAFLKEIADLNLPEIPVAAQCLQDGAQLVIVDADGLVGGPCCTIILGRRDLITQIERHPIARAVRPEKLTLAALAATLQLHLDPATLRQRLPVVQLIGASAENLKGRAERLASQLASCAAVTRAEAVATTACLVSAEVPAQQLPSWAVAVEPESGSAEKLSGWLRGGPTAVLGRVTGERFLLDLRTVLPRQDVQLLDAFESLGEST